MITDSTRERLIEAATGLFAAHGFRGASVRDICNLARANPGAISYHFGSKRQLYRTVLRHAIEGLVERVVTSLRQAPSAAGEWDAVTVAVQQVLRELDGDPHPLQLVVHDLAEGGGVAVETLAPALAGASTALRTASGAPDTPSAESWARLLFLQVAAPLFLLTAGWPVLERALGLPRAQREALLAVMVERAVTGPTRL